MTGPQEDRPPEETPDEAKKRLNAVILRRYRHRQWQRRQRTPTTEEKP